MNSRFHASPELRCGALPLFFQRGVILFVTLIILVSIALACAALMRSVDASVTALGNLALHQAAQAPAFWAVDESMHFLGTAATESTSASTGYYASLQESNAAGIPHQLIGPSPENVRTLQDQVDNTLYYLIERMCLHDGPPRSNHCPSGMLPNEVIVDFEEDEFPAALYRITVRIDGPRRTTVYMQAILRHAEPPFSGVLKDKRLSARFIDL